MCNVYAYYLFFSRAHTISYTLFFPYNFSFVCRRRRRNIDNVVTVLTMLIIPITNDIHKVMKIHTHFRAMLFMPSRLSVSVFFGGFIGIVNIGLMLNIVVGFVHKTQSENQAIS